MKKNTIINLTKLKATLKGNVMLEEMKNNGYEILSAETYIAMKANKEDWKKYIKNYKYVIDK